MEIKIDPKYTLPPDQYIHGNQTKDLLVLHHTVGGSALSSVDWWKKDPQRVGTAFIIDRDGTIYQCFDPRAWAFHLGLKGTNLRARAVDQRSIGIELASEGGLTEKDGTLYCFDRISPRTAFARVPGTTPNPMADEHFARTVYDHGKKWRGAYRYFDRYDSGQMASLVWLVKYLMDRFPIPRKTPKDHVDGRVPFSYQGVIGHHHIRGDKTDLHPGFDWKRLMAECSLTED